MGGWGSGRSGGRPVAEHCFRIDLPWMFKTGRITPGAHVNWSLHWNCGGEPSGNINYEAIMDEPGDERLILKFTQGSGADKETVRQEVRLVWTQPHYGGRRWWMVCPYKGTRCTKLFLPGNGDRFASRAAWKVHYKSQRADWHDQPFERLNRLQRKLGCREGYDEWLFRPKGMWHRTFARHYAKFEKLNAQCDRVWVGMAAQLGVIRAKL